MIDTVAESNRGILLLNVLCRFCDFLLSPFFFFFFGVSFVTDVECFFEVESYRQEYTAEL